MVINQKIIREFIRLLRLSNKVERSEKQSMITYPVDKKLSDWAGKI